MARYKTFNVVLLDHRVLQIQIEAKATYYEVFEKTCVAIGLSETQMFGLAFKSDEGDYWFVDLSAPVNKPAIRDSRSLQLSQLTTVHFRVQYYVDCLELLKENSARHFYYLQLKDNFVHYDYECTEERCFILAAYALQADFGKYDCNKHNENYFDPSHYFPAWVVSIYGACFISIHMPIMHSDLHSMSREEAQLTYMFELSMRSPSAYNLHMYRLKQSKRQESDSAFLAIGATGVEVCEISSTEFVRPATIFPWSNIERIVCEKRKLKLTFSQASPMQSLELFAASCEWSNYLLCFIRHTHLVQMGRQQQAVMSPAALCGNALPGRRMYRESYIHSDGADLQWEREQSLIGNMLHVQTRSPAALTSRVAADNRISVISNGSSNTTSGFVSDRLQASFDESEVETEHDKKKPGLHSTKEVPSSSVSQPHKVGRRKSKPTHKLTHKLAPTSDVALDASQKVAHYLNTSLALKSSAEGSAVSGKLVHRATSDPSKQPTDGARAAIAIADGYASPCGARRAISDNELVIGSSTHYRQAPEHIYENIASYLRLVTPATGTSTAKTAATLRENQSCFSSSEDMLSVSREDGLNRNDEARAKGALPSHSWPSAERDVSLPPPPSYADAQMHKQRRQNRATAAIQPQQKAVHLTSNEMDCLPAGLSLSQPSFLASREKDAPLLRQLHLKQVASSQSSGPYPLTTSASVERMHASAYGWNQMQGQKQANTQERYASAGFLDSNQNSPLRVTGGVGPLDCPRHKKSHPDINKLMDMASLHDLSLPLITALCNDKHLTSMEAQCACGQPSLRHKGGQDSIVDRPTSWHCGESSLGPPMHSRVHTQTDVAAIASGTGSIAAPKLVV